MLSLGLLTPMIVRGKYGSNGSGLAVADVDVRRAEIERRAAEYESLSDLGSIFGAAAVLAQDVPWLLARLKEHDERHERFNALLAELRPDGSAYHDRAWVEALEQFRTMEATFVARSGGEPA